MLLEGKVAIITGAARGTGATIARRFVEEGAKIVVADIREDEGQATAKACGDDAYFQRLDVTDDASWDQAVAKVLEIHGRIDVLVNNAAILHMGNLEHTSSDVFRRLFEVNALGAFVGIRAVVGPMRTAGGGSIVNLASVAALAGLNGNSAYTASKFAMRGMTKSVALEVGRDNIRVNTVCPAGGNAAMFAPWADQLASMSADSAAYHGARAIPRAAQVDEVADAVVFLASDLSRFITGADVPVDGGQTAGHFVAGFNTL